MILRQSISEEPRLVPVGLSPAADRSRGSHARAGVSEEWGDCRVSSSSSAVSSSEGAVGRDRVAAASASVNSVVIQNYPQ